MDQAAPAPAAQVPSTSGTSTAEQGHAQLRQLIRSVREMVALRVSPAPAPDSAAEAASGSGDASTSSQQQQMEALQRQYETCREALRATFRQLDEAADVAAASSSAAQEAHAAMDIAGASHALGHLSHVDCWWKVAVLHCKQMAPIEVPSRPRGAGRSCGLERRRFLNLLVHRCQCGMCAYGPTSLSTR